jgi:hypothetical protein
MRTLDSPLQGNRVCPAGRREIPRKLCFFVSKRTNEFRCPSGGENQFPGGSCTRSPAPFAAHWFTDREQRMEVLQFKACAKVTILKGDFETRVRFCR